MASMISLTEAPSTSGFLAVLVGHQLSTTSSNQRHWCAPIAWYSRSWRGYLNPKFDGWYSTGRPVLAVAARSSWPTRAYASFM